MSLWEECTKIAPRVTADIESFVAEHLTDPPTERADPKIIHDAVHGTYSLEGWEIAILDTPLLQRLRYIHQTSHAYLTYPSARHDRFQHSLGVRMGAERILRHISLRSSEVPSEQRVNVQFAALVHDVGHGFGSHISEEIYGTDEELSQLRELEFLRKSSPHERLSFLVVQSPSFRAFAEELGRVYGHAFDFEMIGRLIVGSIEDPDLFYLQEIINGPFDADKMDYFLRDSRFTGIPLAVDIDRLLAFIEIEQLNPAQEVEEVAQDPEIEATLRGRNRAEKHLVLGIRGVTAVEQMIFNRFVLTSAIYQHHKVRAADILMVRLATRLRDTGAVIQGTSLDTVSAFMRLDDGALLRYKGDDELAVEMANRLRFRHLPRRSLVLSRTTVDKVNSIYHQLGNRSGKSAVASARARELIATAIWDLAKIQAPTLPREFVWIDVPKNPEYSDAARCFVRQRRGRYSILSELANMQQMKESFSRSKYRAHVFTVSPFEAVVAEAARQVLEDLYNVAVLPSAFEEAKVSP